MKINIKEFLAESGIHEPFYPGKRLVHACRQSGEFKSHCVVLDWRDPSRVRIEVKAGLSGRDLEPKKLKYYPVCFQTPTYIDIDIPNDNKDEDEEKSSGKGSAKGGGSKGPARKSLSDLQSTALKAFGEVREGNIQALGRIVDMVVLGTKIAQEAYGNVMGQLAKQIQHAKVSATDLLARAGNFVTKYTPPAFLQPTGDEDAVYKYDREKNADIGYRSPGLG